MALLRSCCCWLSLRKGSFACGVYTLIFYTMLVATGGSHLSSVPHSPVGFSLVLLLLTLSGLCVVFSVVLLLGLVFDNRLLLLPWLTFVSMTTLLDVALSLYFIRDFKLDSFVVVMYIIDYTLCSINIYCILCVLSQYQQYARERRTIGHASSAPPKDPAPVIQRDGPKLAGLPRIASGISNHSSSRCTFSRIASWPGRRIGRKAAPFAQNGARVSPCSFVSLAIPAVTVTTTATGKTTNGVSQIVQESSSAPVCPCAVAYHVEDTSSGIRLSTAEASL
ncbi:uncharacterized protein LOC144127493 [Amblyomma americanum]